MIKYCPANVTFSDIWIEYGISQCSLQTVISLALTAFVLIFGSIEMLVYRKNATPVDESLQIPVSKLYQAQLLLLTVSAVSPFADIILNLYFAPEINIYGYTIVTSILTCISMLFSIRLALLERNYSLKFAATNGHGIVLLLFWSLAFLNENLVMLVMKNRDWCFYILYDVVKLVWLIMRYTCAFSMLVLGLMAPGIGPDQGYTKLDDGKPETHSSWSNSYKSLKKVAKLLWTKENFGLRVRIVLCVCLLLVERFVNLLVPVYNQKIVDSLGAKEFRWDLILIFVGFRFLQGGASLSSGVLCNIRTFLWDGVQQFMSRETECELFAQLHNLSLRWHLSRKTGEVLNVMDRGPHSVVSILNLVITWTGPAIVDIVIAILFFSLTVDWHFGVIFLASVSIYLWLIVFLTKWQSKIQKQVYESDNERTSQGIDSLLNFETVKYYGAEKYEVDVYCKAILEQQKNDSFSFGSSCVADMAKNIVICSSLLASSLLCAYLIVEEGTLTAGQYVLFSTYIIELYSPISDFGWMYGYVQELLVVMEEMFKVLEETPEVIDSPDAIELKSSDGSIEFSNVTFAYNADDRVILKDVSFKVPSGKTVAIVGPTGSGKSTIIRLLFRFYDVNAGSITIDGHDITAVTQESLRRVIGVVPQDTVLFNNTVKYNIRYGRLDATDEEVIEAARAAEIHETVMSFPDKYDSQVGERGLKLSGGEKQRVAIARTILKRPSIVLLDEATSSLDMKTERNIQAALSKVCSNRTTIIVAHRLSTVIHADEILVLKDGEIVERGRHDVLLREDGVYADMWKQHLKHDNEIVDDGDVAAK